jgi:hypothetical protein
MIVFSKGSGVDASDVDGCELRHVKELEVQEP